MLAVAALPAPALAQTGGGTVVPSQPVAGSDGGGGTYGTVAPGERKRAKPRKRSRERRGGSLLTSFKLSRPRLFLHGRPARVTFRISGRRAVRMRLGVLRASDRARVATIDLGERAPGVEHSISLRGIEAGVLPQGRYVLHIAGRRLRRAASASSTAELSFFHHVFPLAGAFSYGGEDARFGAPRSGHRHQGQDLAAAEGTPVVAPRGGTVEAVQYQARGAGHYVVLDGDGEDRDYVFMHLRTGSIPVREGQRIRTGQRVGEVGNTGRSFGAHLHFEIWVGGWYAGGKPVDPLPLLKRWDGWS